MPDNTAGLTPIQSMVYDAVREIVEIKRGNVTPALATLPEVYNIICSMSKSLKPCGSFTASD